jgi:hypothetical protein
MAPASLTAQQHAEIHRRVHLGQTHRDIAREMGLSVGIISHYRNLPLTQAAATHFIAPIFHDKKEAEFNWRDWGKHAQTTQALYHKASQTQKTASIEIPANEPILLVPFSDQHIGGRGVRYDEFERLTDQILNTPNVYLALVGDYMEYAIKLRSVAEVCAQIFDPAKQDQFIEQWFDEIWHKVLWATWDNHVIERQEKQSGSSSTKRYMAKKVVFFDGIGHVDLTVGNEIYRIAVSHKFRGYSYQNPCHAGMRYMRFEGTDREIAIMGDIHTPAFISYNDGDKERLSLVSGTLNTRSVYAERYFSIFTQSHYPVIELDPQQHCFTPFKSIDRWLRMRGRKDVLAI